MERRQCFGAGIFLKGISKTLKSVSKSSRAGDKEQFRIDRSPFLVGFCIPSLSRKGFERQYKVLSRSASRWQETGTQSGTSLAIAHKSRIRSRQTDRREKQDRQLITFSATGLNYVSWRIFAEACKKAAEDQSAQTRQISTLALILRKFRQSRFRH